MSKFNSFLIAAVWFAIAALASYFLPEWLVDALILALLSLIFGVLASVIDKEKK